MFERAVGSHTENRSRPTPVVATEHFDQLGGCPHVRQALAAACDRFDTYDSLPGVTRPTPSQTDVTASPTRARGRKRTTEPGADLRKLK